MFKDPTDKGSSPVELGNYISKLLSLEDIGESSFKPGERRILWKWNLAEAKSKALLRDGEGEPYVFFVYSSDNMGPGSTARMLAEALLGRRLEEGESGAQIAEEVIGKFALLSIGPHPKTGKTVPLQAEPMPSASGNGATRPQPKLVTAPKAEPAPDRTYEELFGESAPA